MSVRFNFKRLENQCCKDFLVDRFTRNKKKIETFVKTGEAFECPSCCTKLMIRSLKPSKTKEKDQIARFRQDGYFDFKEEDIFSIKDFIS